MNDPRDERYEPTSAGSHAATPLEDRTDAARIEPGRIDAGREYTEGEYERTGDLPTTGVDADAALEESVDDGLHHGHQHGHQHDGEFDGVTAEHEHELPTMGVDVDAALDRAVEHEI